MQSLKKTAYINKTYGILEWVGGLLRSGKYTIEEVQDRILPQNLTDFELNEINNLSDEDFSAFGSLAALIFCKEVKNDELEMKIKCLHFAYSVESLVRKNLVKQLGRFSAKNITSIKNNISFTSPNINKKNSRTS